MLDAALQMLWSDCYYNHTWVDTKGAADTQCGEALAMAPPIMEVLCPGQSEMNGDELGIRTAEETLRDPEYTTKYLEQVSHFMFGIHWAAKAPWAFSATPVVPRPAAPMIGEHSTRVLEALGYSASEID